MPYKDITSSFSATERNCTSTVKCNVPFYVSVVREDLAKCLDLNQPADSFIWNKMATSKVNLFVWRAIKGKIPTRESLAGRGVNILDKSCPMCGYVNESTDHVLVACPFANLGWSQTFI